jgi:hypothetical protein
VEVFHSEVKSINLALSEKELYSKITKGLYIFPDFVSNEAKTLIQKILHVNPQNRLSADNVLIINLDY